MPKFKEEKSVNIELDGEKIKVRPFKMVNEKQKRKDKDQENIEQQEEKCFDYEVTVIFTQREHAQNEEQARENLKESFVDSYGLHLDDDEINLLK